MAKIELPNTSQHGILSTTRANGLLNMDALEAGLRQLTQVIDFLPDATFVVDNAGKVIAWNKAIEKMTGVPKQEIIGKGDYSYAIPFYGSPRPILIDFALNPDTAGAARLAERGDPRIGSGAGSGRCAPVPPLAESTGEYYFITWDNDVVFGETYVPDACGGTGAYVWGVASALYDHDKNLIGAIESIRDISSRRMLEKSLYQREKDLKEKAGQLEEINTALRVLLKNREDDWKKLENDIQSNLKQLVLPYLDRVKNGRLDQNQKACLELIESSLEKILSPFIRNMHPAFHVLSPTEIQIAHLIKEGKRSKEIASLLNMAYKTVETHRYNLRIKLGIKNEKINLQSYLLSIR
ncbi:MAG: LuxR C-terminal-related transcriptional regulator [Syntrophobacteraceae bacterium]